ncbi:hypothetical protein B7C51_25205 (plasmid) [Paenibacillus larvae subsp. pulvifaciens]|uniref:Uncharacterized protein n=1 Tax=Paenibacillus larvae subsp. pulvifaciens TaxID=1477 RepID=A0A1V0V091_9BACL|nr:hypothetical protein [Paenibacillus larvae]ARF70771.1 hypothetical protein B7C51_25205 [Paenibacillus larvae subsp. pulvifaciens]
MKLNYFELYKKRLERSGENSGESVWNSSVNLINQTFENSHNFRKVKIDGHEVDARILEGKHYYERKLLFRPNQITKLGSLVEFDNETWMIFESFNETISPKASVRHLNEYLRWYDKEKNIHKVKCLAMATRITKYDITPNRYDIDLLAGGIYAIAQSNEEIKTIKPSQRFILGESVYEIAGIDDVTYRNADGSGIIQFTCKLTTFMDSDNRIEKIADNTLLYRDKNGDNEGENSWWT